MRSAPVRRASLRSERSQATAVMVQSWSNSRVGATAEASGLRALVQLDWVHSWRFETFTASSKRATGSWH